MTMPNNLETPDGLSPRKIVVELFDSLMCAAASCSEPAKAIIILELLTHFSKSSSPPLIKDSLNISNICFLSCVLPMGLVVNKNLMLLKEYPHDAQHQQAHHDTIVREFQQGLVISAMVAIPLFVPFAFSQTFLTSIFRVTDSVAAETQDFLRPVMIGALAKLVQMSIRQVLIGNGKVWPSAVFGGVSLLANGGLSIALKSYKNGVAYANVLAEYLEATLFFIYIAHDPKFKNCSFFGLQLIANNIKKIFEPGSLLFRAAPALFSNMVAIVAMLGTGYIAAQTTNAPQVQRPFYFFMNMTLISFFARATFSLSTCIKINSLLSKNNNRAAVKMAISSILFTSIYTLPTLGFFTFSPKLFLPTEKEIQKETWCLMIIMGFCIVLDVVRYALLQQLRINFKDPNIALLVSAITLLPIGLTLSWGLDQTSLNTQGAGVGALIALSAATFSLCLRWAKPINTLRKNLTFFNSPEDENIQSQQPPQGIEYRRF